MRPSKPSSEDFDELTRRVVADRKVRRLNWRKTTKTRAQAVADALKETHAHAKRMAQVHIESTLKYHEDKLAREVENLVGKLVIACAGVVCIVPSLVVGAGWLAAKKARRSIASLVR